MKDIRIPLTVFLLWRLLTTIGLAVGLIFIPVHFNDRFLGGGSNYFINPVIFSWSNFDGEHYMSIARYGYKNLQHFFFPFYPLLIALLSKVIPPNPNLEYLNFAQAGILISNGCFLLSLIIFYKLLMLDYDKKVATWSLLTLAFFPTSFYFGAVYNESLFLLLSLSCFYFAKRNKWVLAGIVGFLATTTRIFGLLLLPALLTRTYLEKVIFKKSLWLTLIPLGLVSYMIFLRKSTGDFLAFYHGLSLFGPQRQSHLVFLPLVYFRYIKILLLTPFSWEYQTYLLEFVLGIVSLILLVYGYFKRVPLDYLFYFLLILIISSITGSFSSLPRYVLVAFPGSLLVSLFLLSKELYIRYVYLFVLSILLIIETALFLRGYWVA